ncbi:hypothetical protein JYT36_00990, partial [Bacteroidales bacterium AH-315-N07]|nr:hypothetical protein [Bacteroidales bacterium AH-315-N07]
NNIDKGNWTSAICDINLCYRYDVDTADFTLSAGQEGIMDGHFYPAGTVGDGSMTVLVFDVNDPSDSMRIVFNGSAWPVGINGVDLKRNEFNVYPNPAYEEINNNNHNVLAV